MSQRGHMENQKNQKSNLKDIEVKKFKLLQSIKKLKTKILLLTGSITRTDALNELAILEKIAHNLGMEGELLNNKAAKKMFACETQLSYLSLKIKNGELTKEKVNDKLKNIALNLPSSTDEKENSPIDKEIIPIQNIKFTKIGKDPETKIVTAPFLFSFPFPLNESKLKKLEHGFKLRQILVFPHYYLCENAPFLVIGTKGLPTNVPISKKADQILDSFSKVKGLNTRLSAVHEISKFSSTWYAVLVINSNIEEEITSITNTILKQKDPKKKDVNAPVGVGESRFTIYLE